MATLIICPACGTRYETAAVFPPEGRKVRCSKCTHVWQALPVTGPLEPMLAATPPEAAVAATPPPPPSPKAGATVNTGMRGFAGITQSAPAETGLSDRFAQADTDADFGSEEDLAAQAAYLNDEAAAVAEVPAPAAQKSGGIFARLARRSPAPSAPPAPSTDAGRADADISEADKEAARAEAAMLQAAFGGDVAALDGTANLDLPGERPRRKKSSVVTIGWAVLALILAIVIGTLMLAPSAVMSVLPGAARLYALFGTPVGSSGLAFEGVRYGWTSEGGQTVLEVQGDVVNATSGSVGVPTVVIALRDESGEEISEWTTQVGETELTAGQRAPFLRQIPSPPSNVRSVKVRFAKAD